MSEDAPGPPGDLAARLGEAEAARRRGDLAAAFRTLHECLTEAELDGTVPGTVARIQLDLGGVAARFGDTAEARDWFERAAASAPDDDPGRADVNLALARLDARAGLGGDARRRLGAALKAYQAAGAARGVARCHLELADLYVVSGDPTVAGLELRAAGALRDGSDPDDLTEYHLVSARVRAAAGDRSGAEADLEAAVASAPPGDAARAGELGRIAEAWRADPFAPPARSAPAPGIDMASGVRFVSIVVGPDGLIGQAEVVDSTSLDGAHLAALRPFLSGAGREARGVPVPGPPRVEIGFFPDHVAFGVAVATYEVGADPCGFSVVATGADERDRARLAQSDALVSYFAGRWRTDTYIGFSRHQALRPGALSAVTERPVALFVPHHRAGEREARLGYERHLELAAAFIALVEEDGDAARRLRRLVRPDEDRGPGGEPRP
ncbi:MAG TPA: hypothetical protein VFO65_06550 [Acidimicrobiales bacterium]|nr:hypothetical protein [Acidimicrobiales bacterium]